MKKITLICTISLLSVTSVFGFNLKRSANSAYNDAKNYVKSFDSEEIKTSVEDAMEKTGDVLTNAYKETKEFFEEIDTEKTEDYLKEAAEATGEAFEKAGAKTKKGIVNAFHETKEFFEEIDTESIEDYLKDAADTGFETLKKTGKKTKKAMVNAYHEILDLFDNAKVEEIQSYINEAEFFDSLNKPECPHLSIDEIQITVQEAESNIEDFTKNYPLIIQRLKEQSKMPLYVSDLFTPAELDMTEIEFIKMSKHYNLFVTSCMYVKTTQELANTPSYNVETLKKLCNTMEKLLLLMRNRAQNLGN